MRGSFLVSMPFECHDCIFRALSQTKPLYVFYSTKRKVWKFDESFLLGLTKDLKLRNKLTYAQTTVTRDVTHLKESRKSELRSNIPNEKNGKETAGEPFSEGQQPSRSRRL